jgi:predicted NBD/HSP70 family sugar kinase
MCAEAANRLLHSELAILDVLRQRGPATRGEVAAAIGLSLAMTARLVARLQDAGLVRAAGRTVGPGRKRQALLVELDPKVAYVAGVDIGTDVVHLLVADLHGRTQAYREVSSGALANLSREEIVTTLRDLIHEVVQSAAIPSARLSAVGVALTGIVASDDGVCLMRSNTPGWENFALSAQLGAALGLPVLLEETARAKSVAELHYGVARGRRHFLYIEAGASIGASIVIDGHPFRGIDGVAGELGHVTADPGGPLCRCGNRGCVQTTASARALLGQARERLQAGAISALAGMGTTLTLSDIASAAANGDKMAVGLLTEAGEQLGEAIGMALNLLGLDLVVMGGTLAHCGPIVVEAARRIVRLRVLPLAPRERVVLPTSLGSDAAARGVALQANDWLMTASPERILNLATVGGGRRVARTMAAV